MKLSQYFMFILLSTLVVLSVLNYCTVRKLTPSTNTIEIIKGVDTINIKKDSVINIIREKDKQIIENNVKHEEIVNTIINQPNHLDSIFARDYIQKFINERVR